MAVLQIVEEWKTFRNHLRQSEPEAIPVPMCTEPESRQSWIVSLKHKTTICAVLSPSHTIQLQAGKF